MKQIGRAAVVVFALSVAITLAAGEPARDARHLIYLHGRIVQVQQSERPEHPEYGHYELNAIVEAFRAHGFEVTGEIRPRDATVGGYADHVVAQVQRLIASGVTPKHITVVGASMGSGIALRTAFRLQNPDVRFVLLSPCLATNLRAVAAEEGGSPKGHILAIRDESDVPTKDCPAWTQEPTADLTAREVVIDTGRGHGFLYRPLAEWMKPAVAWARGE